MQSHKTGILYDPFSLKHKCGRDHPERPQRVESIIDNFRAKHYLEHPEIEFIDKLPEAPLEIINLVHSQKYTNHVTNLWDESCNRTHLMVLDTYFNEHSNKASNLAVGGVLVGIDNIISKRWRNAFAVVRPPGHHSGARNVINGFCIYNNVAIGVKYLRNKYNLKKIAIFDWDVHHGDGTQHILREDPDTLFISLHRHDNGTFYPGQSGSCRNIGQGAAEGKQLNVPWNTVDEKDQEYDQMPGDNEYIYIFERALLPILKEFKPQFIFISAGFDSARGDPLGGMSVGPEAYHYMTSKLLTLAPTLVVLEGGYNLRSLSWAAESVLCALIGKQGPRETTLQPTEMKDRCWLPDYYHKNLDEVIEVYKKYWPLLNQPKLVQYENQIKANKSKAFGKQKGENTPVQEEKEQSQKFGKSTKVEQKKYIKQDEQNLVLSKADWQYYIVGGHMDVVRVQKDKFYKTPKNREQEFYESDFPEKKFAPKYYGQHQKQIVIEYLLYGLNNPNVIDIKLGGVVSAGNAAKMAYRQYKFDQSSAKTLGFRIVGYVSSKQRVSRGRSLLTKDQTLIRKIMGDVILPEHRKQVTEFITDLAQTLRLCNRKYKASSIFIVSGEELRIRWIDFTFMEQSDSYDEEVIKGLENLRRFVVQLG